MFPHLFGRIVKERSYRTSLSTAYSPAGCQWLGMWTSPARSPANRDDIPGMSGRTRGRWPFSLEKSRDGRLPTCRPHGPTCHRSLRLADEPLTGTGSRTSPCGGKSGRPADPTGGNDSLERRRPAVAGRGRQRRACQPFPPRRAIGAAAGSRRSRHRSLRPATRPTRFPRRRGAAAADSHIAPCRGGFARCAGAEGFNHGWRRANEGFHQGSCEGDERAPGLV